VNNNISSRLYYPNPFQPTGIEFTLEEKARVTLKILDDDGKGIEILIDNQFYSEGNYVVPLDTVKYKTGEYWYRITVIIGEKISSDTKQII